jgi:DNA mismatch endonuclease (patch repair protein)
MQVRKGKQVLTKSEQMSRVRTKHTKSEMLLRRALWSLGLRYRLHPSLPGKPDCVFVRKRVAIFVDGCFWHGCPIHYIPPRKNAEFWKSKIEKNLLRDMKVNAELEASGWNVLRFWEHEIDADVENCVRRIVAALT